MAVHNIMEVIVTQLLEEFKKNYSLKCSCVACRESILAITLNQLPPRYVSTSKGEIITKALYMDTQMKQDIVRELTYAALRVEGNPKH